MKSCGDQFSQRALKDCEGRRDGFKKDRPEGDGHGVKDSTPFNLQNSERLGKGGEYGNSPLWPTFKIGNKELYVQVARHGLGLLTSWLIRLKRRGA